MARFGPAERKVAALALATVATVYPGFLLGAIAVQVPAEFEVSEAAHGWGLGSFHSRRSDRLG